MLRIKILTPRRPFHLPIFIHMSFPHPSHFPSILYLHIFLSVSSSFLLVSGCWMSCSHFSSRVGKPRFSYALSIMSHFYVLADLADLAYLAPLTEFWHIWHPNRFFSRLRNRAL